MSARLLDKKINGRFPFEYRNAAATDVRKTFERVREEMKRVADADEKERTQKLISMRKR